MGRDGSVTHWIHEAREGDPVAVQRLWERYYQRLVDLARRQLHTGNRRVTDEDDLASQVFEAFFRASSEGRFPDLSDRDELWRLLVRMTARKAIDQHRRQRRQRRGGGKVRGESVFQAEDSARYSLDQIVGDDPAPEFVTSMKEQVGLLLKALQSDELRQLASDKLQGFTNAEMAERWECSERTIERKMKLIRAKLNDELNCDE